jgi:hypothetical protein
MRRSILVAAVSIFLPWQSPALGELYLTAELLPVMGGTTIETYRITATSNLGSVVAADFTKVNSFGITGSIGQVNSGGEPTIFSNVTANENATIHQDSQFLVTSDEVLSLFTEESESGLHGAFAFIGDKQFSAGQSLPFAQVSTSDPSGVNLKGAFVVRRANGDLIETEINVSLSDIPLGPAPVLDLLPIPEPTPEPVYATPVPIERTPPVVIPPLINTPPNENLTQTGGPDDPSNGQSGPDQVVELRPWNDRPFDPRVSLVEHVYYWDRGDFGSVVEVVPIGPDTSQFDIQIIDVSSIDFTTAVEMTLVDNMWLAALVPVSDGQVFTAGLLNEAGGDLARSFGTFRQRGSDWTLTTANTLSLSGEMTQREAVPEPSASLLVLIAITIAQIGFHPSVAITKCSHHEV